jgi:two-component system cell cycle response regulator
MVVVVLILFSEHFAERNELELQLMADTDALTQLPNRRAFRARLGRALEAAERDGGQIAVALLDVDFFKHVNDTYGHDAGDMCLQTLARLLQGQLRADDVVARMGGEEFALLMPQTTLDQARVIAERMRAVVARHAFALAGSDELLSVQISIGLAALTPGERVDQAMKAADDALYRAKASGRNRVVVQAGGG